MTELLSSLVRGLFMLAAGVLVLVVAAVLLLFTLAFVLVATVWGLLNGRKPSAGASWTRFQQSAASTVWQRYREQAAGAARQPSAGPSAKADEVVDVDFREVSPGRASPVDPTRRIES